MRSNIPVGSLGTAAAIALAAALVMLLAPGSARAQVLPERFQQEVVFQGLNQPSAVRFSPDGRVFVAEKSGLIKVFSGLGDPTATVFADLRTQVHNFWDRGLLGLALDPAFPEEPYVYVLYTHDFDPAVPGEFPRWGNPDQTEDGCPTPPGAVGDGCVVNGRLSRLEADGDVMSGPEQVLLEGGWCQQYPSHTVGSLGFGPDGALYVSAGDGASFNFEDFGQDGSPLNPCGDPPAGVGGVQTPPSAEGGALRSQDLRSAADPTSLDGSLLRLDPDTGGPFPGNPGSGDANARRIVAHGFRNPFRFTIRPGTGELWIGDVGWTTWEEINRLTDPAGAPVENFGWPCYEGTPRQGGYDGRNLSLCESLYAAGTGAVTAPYYAYSHSDKVVPAEGCPSGGSAISGLAFYDGGIYPAEYDGALFFSDHARGCIWAMLAGPGGDPDPDEIVTLVDGAANPVDLQIGPGGDLFYVDFNGGTVRRVTYSPELEPPDAIIDAPEPSLLWRVGETITFAGRGVDPQDGELPPSSLDWELTLCPAACQSEPIVSFPGVGGGAFAAPDHRYPAHLELRLTVTDSTGLEDDATLRLDPETVELLLMSSPLPGVPMAFNDATGASPLQGTAIVGSHNSLAAPPLVSRGKARWWLRAWSDGGAPAHAVVAPASPTTYTARYSRLPEACGSASPNLVVGTEARETLDGTTGADAIMALGGADAAAGLAGGDCLVGGGGADALRGNAGGDRLLGGASADRLRGGDGHDLLDGGAGNDVLRGDAGRDEVRCGAGVDTVVLGGGGRDDVARSCERVSRR
jgi:glucose/arabinose dehydrogenase